MDIMHIEVSLIATERRVESSSKAKDLPNLSNRTEKRQIDCFDLSHKDRINKIRQELLNLVDVLIPKQD